MSTPTLPERLGPYRVIRKIGEGGMGTVYEAVDETDRLGGERVAVKTLSPHLAQRGGFRERFRSEIESLRKLEHPNIVRIIAYGEERGTLFYSMELVEGSTLEAVLHRGERCTWQEAVEAGEQVCAALKHAHDRGVIHRDIKPANLMRTPDGVIKLSDFGIARLFWDANETLGGGPIGTAGYMSPEQADGKRATERSDLYSVGCVLYALLAGRPPFLAPTLLEVLNLQRSAAPPPLRQHAPETPEQLVVVIHRLLEKSPEERPPNAGVLLRSLQMVVRSQALLNGQTIDMDLIDGDRASGAAATASPQDATLARPPGVSPSSGGAARSASGAQPPIGEYELTSPGESRAALAAGTPRSGGVAPPGSAATEEESPAAAAEPATRFITAAEARRREAERARAEAQAEERSGRATTIRLLVIVGIGVAAILGLWSYVHSRSHSADRLYMNVKAIAQDPDRLADAEGDLLEFLRLYPGDERAAELKGYEEELDLQRLERQARARARGILGGEAQSPVERAYLEAISYPPSEAERSKAMLDAMVNLYEGGDGLSERDARYVALARRRAGQLQGQISQYAGGAVLSVRKQLDRAEALAASDPAAARRVCESVLELYGERAWAKPLAERARAILAALPAEGEGAATQAE